MENQIPNEEFLPKPLADLPLPEKELSEHATPASKGLTFQGYFSRFPLILMIPSVLLILLVLVGGAYFLGRNSVFKELNPTAPEIPSPGPLFQASPTPDPTANWKTYVSESGFKIEYPLDLDFKQNQESFQEAIIFKTTPNNNLKYEMSVILQKPELNKNNKSLDEIVEEGKKNVDLDSESDVKRIKIDGENAVNLPAADGGRGIYILHKNKIYSIFYYFNSIEYEQKINQILSTFKFTDTVSGTGVSGKIILSPTCGGPAQSGENCTKPYKATVIVKNKTTRKEITRFTSDANGNFSVKLEPGFYILEPINKPNDIYPVGKPQEVKVTEGKMTDVTIIYETGML